METLLVILVVINLLLTLTSIFAMYLITKRMEESIKRNFSTLEFKLMQSLRQEVSPIISKIEKIGSPIRKNEIEKMEEEDIPITDAFRIPIMNGMKVKFEDEKDPREINIFSDNG